MTRIAIRSDNLGKWYRVGERQSYRTLRDSVAHGLQTIIRPRPRGQPDRMAAPRPLPGIWALRDVSFEVSKGDVVGVIGRNGAGKSTLLKVLSRITEPSRGVVDIFGRVGSLLEVGTGFNPELTGRENTYLNGAILGMRKAEIDRRFDEIVGFAEVHDFLDTPVKHYSSGMYMRLAFSVAAHLETDILLVDEVLAVGDTRFQEKCLGKIGSVARDGRTVFLVSHNLDAVLSLCTTALWLEGGSLRAGGSPRTLVSQYLSAGTTSGTAANFPLPSSRSPIAILSAEVSDARGRPTGSLDFRHPFILGVTYQLRAPLSSYEISFRITDRTGRNLLFTGTGDDHTSMPPSAVGTYRAAVEIPGHLLMPNRYNVDITCYSRATEIYHQLLAALPFEIENTSRFAGGELAVASVNPLLRWTHSLSSPSSPRATAAPQ